MTGMTRFIAPVCLAVISIAFVITGGIAHASIVAYTIAISNVVCHRHDGNYECEMDGNYTCHNVSYYDEPMFITTYTIPHDTIDITLAACNKQITARSKMYYGLGVGGFIIVFIMCSLAGATAA